MTAPIKNALQTYQTILYDRVLHPEWFRLSGRDQVSHRGYELELWLTPGGHVLRFDHADHRISELVTEQESNLPDTGVIAAALCAGERDFEHEFTERGITYMTSVQTEQLSENLYHATLDEMRSHIHENESMHHAWDCEDGPCLSVLDTQPFNREIHVQSYHLIASGGVVLRTQTIFEHS